MSILGKLLIVFNLLAAGAFAHFTLANWKVRQDLTWAAVSNQVKLDGVALEPREAPADLSPDRAPFYFMMPNGGTHLTSIPKDRFDALIPKGDVKFGGEPVADQTTEIKRVHQKVQAALPTADGQGPPARLNELGRYLINLARSGAERDGVNALFIMLDPARAENAKRDLPFLCRTNSQSNALQTLVEIAALGDPEALTEDVRATRVGDTREALKRFLRGELPHGLPPGTQKNDDADRKATNALENALVDKAGEDTKKTLIDATTGDAEGWKELANLAVEPLADKKSIDRAIESLTKFVTVKAVTPTESAYLTALKTLIRPPALGFVLTQSVNDAATNILNSKFDEAALPSAAHKGHSAGEKARKIAHILYHLDADRHAIRTAEVVAERKAWHERVATIVGMPEYIRAAEAQANEYAEASQRLVSVITEEQSAFEASYQALQQKVLALFSQWLTLDTQLKAQEAITKENVGLKEQRLTERDNLLKELADATEAAKNELAKLQTTQKKLFTIQKDLRDAQAAILALEKELRRLELGN